MSGRGMQPPLESSAPEPTTPAPSIDSFLSSASVLSRSASGFAMSNASTTFSGNNSEYAPTTSTTTYELEPTDRTESGTLRGLGTIVLVVSIVVPIVVFALGIWCCCCCFRHHKRNDAVMQQTIRENGARRAEQARQAEQATGVGTEPLGVRERIRTPSPPPPYVANPGRGEV